MSSHFAMRHGKLKPLPRKRIFRPADAFAELSPLAHFPLRVRGSALAGVTIVGF